MSRSIFRTESTQHSTVVVFKYSLAIFSNLKYRIFLNELRQFRLKKLRHLWKIEQCLEIKNKLELTKLLFIYTKYVR